MTRSGGARAGWTGSGIAGLMALAVSVSAPGVRAQGTPLVAGLSNDLVAITTGFAGANVLLFGATEGEGDVVVIVRGPDRRVVMHRKSRVLGVWANTAQMTFDRAPSFYAIASSRPLAEIAQPTVLARHQMGLDNLRLELPRAKASANVAQEWRAGLIRNQETLGLYQSEIGRVTFLGNRLFRTRLQFPANVPTGVYQVQVFLLQGGHMISAQTSSLYIDKSGAEAAVYDFAYQNSALYGLFAILVALVAGWAAHMAFRKA